MLSFILKYKTESAKDLFNSIKNQMYSNDRSKTEVFLENDKIVFKVDAKDLTSLKATFNAISQIISINDKLSLLFDKDLDDIS